MTIVDLDRGARSLIRIVDLYPTKEQKVVDTDIAPFAEKRTRKWKSIWCCGCRGGDGLTCIIGIWFDQSIRPYGTDGSRDGQVERSKAD